LNSNPNRSLTKVGQVLGLCVLILAAWALMFVRTMDRDLNHDEHQFLAPAALVSREGLAPWRDFPLYHLPNLVYAYAAADRVTGDLVFGAKLVNFAASAATLAALVILAWKAAGGDGSLKAELQRWGAAFAVAAVLLADPLYRYTAGKTWNHEVPTALFLGAGGCLLMALRRDNLWWTAASGVLGGLAVGCRLTFASTLVGLFCFTLFFPVPWRRRFAHAGWLTLAATIALGPTLYFLATEPDRFVFANFQFPRLRLVDPSNTRIQKTVSIWRKARYFGKEIVVHSWPVFALWLAMAVRPGWQWLRTRQLGTPAAGLWLLLFPFVLIGCWTPSRYQYQHYFVFVPFLLMAVVSMGEFKSQNQRLKSLVLTIVVLIAAGLGWQARPDYPSLRTLVQPGEWFPFRQRDQAEEIRAAVSTGPVLTLGPTLPLAAKLTIYPEFATGPFGWRSASLVAPERRPRLHLVAPDDLEAFLQGRPPTAILTGVEEDDEEAPLVEWAQRHGFQQRALKKRRTLWLPPARF
jgi:hypothetical protein